MRQPLPTRYVGRLDAFARYLHELLQAAAAPTATTRHPAAQPSVLPQPAPAQ